MLKGVFQIFIWNGIYILKSRTEMNDMHVSSKNIGEKEVINVKRIMKNSKAASNENVLV